MGKCSRNRGKRHQDRDVKHGHGPQVPPRTNPLSQGFPMNDFLKHIRLSDLLGGTLPPGPGPEPSQGRTRPAGQTRGTRPDTGSPAGTP